jgi:hypothetical protein
VSINHASRLAVTALCFAVFTAFAQEPAPSDESLERGLTRNKPYSPYADRNFPRRLLWGDTHLHTGLSFDAGSFGARLMPEDAYRFAKGERVVSSTGQPVKLYRPLDFLVVADHSDNMGFFPLLLDGDPRVIRNPQGKRWHEMVNAGGQEAVTAASEMIAAFTFGKIPKEIMSLPGTGPYRSAWETLIQSAEKANEPGRFTAMIGYEWTSTTGGNNLHRVVIYRDGGGRARLLDPYTTEKPLGSDNPADLWNHVPFGEGLRPATRQGVCRNPGTLGADLRDHPDQGRRRGPSRALQERRVRRLRHLGSG